ncbi:MAG: hypothetical protein WBN40_09240 [Pseudomonadales bacterium]
MITITTLASLFKPLPAGAFCAADYSAFRQHLDSTGAHRPVRTYQFNGALLVTDARHRVLGKIIAPTVDHWGIVQSARYLLPTAEKQIALPQRVILRAHALCSAGFAAMLNHAGKRKMRLKPAGRYILQRNCERRSAVGTVKWKTVRLAG